MFCEPTGIEYNTKERSFWSEAEGEFGLTFIFNLHIENT